MDTSDLIIPEDQYDWELQEIELREDIKRNLPEILKEKADGGINWIVWKIYYLIYNNPLAPKEMHIHRVRPMIETWLENTTYGQLVEAGIITEEDLIKKYK